MSTTRSFDPTELNRADRDRAIEIADGIWWVGHHLPGDPFQCHAYLVEAGDQSVLIDPGGPLILDHVLQKVEEVVAFDDVRWFVCHHQDPDITAGLPRLDAMIQRPDAAVVTHWRAKALIRHYGLRVPFHLVDEHRWHLDLDGRVLRFVFTPYLHFPGAFATFDEQTGTLFSSDLFGGFTEQWRLVAEDLSYFEEMRPFHEHYMPSREILAAGMYTLERLPITLIAPQHGELIPEPLVGPLIDRLKNLDCGLYLMVHEDTDIRRLSEVHRLLRDAVHQIIVSKDFREVVASLLELIRTVFAADALEFYARDGDDVIHLAPANRYRGVPGEIPPELEPLLDIERPVDPTQLPIVQSDDRCVAAMPLYAPLSGRSEGVVVVHLTEPTRFDEATVSALSEVSTPLEVAVERELLLRSVDVRRQELYELAMHDALTGLHNRLYLTGAAERLFALHDRHDVRDIVVTIFDLDRFKAVNDRYGHVAGDRILRTFAATLAECARAGDVFARIGGEEFVALQVVAGDDERATYAQRVLETIRAVRFTGDLVDVRLTASAGVVGREPGESLEHVIARADTALYEAKESGRDRVITA